MMDIVDSFLEPMLCEVWKGSSALGFTGRIQMEAMSFLLRGEGGFVGIYQKQVC
jgi:hypothetical protein